MKKSVFVLPDGREISSGTSASPAVRSVTLTESVSAGTDFQYGSAAAAHLEATLIDTTGTFDSVADQEFRYFEESETGERILIGTFRFEKPTKPSFNSYKVDAYDRMTLLDKDCSMWLAELPNWPYTIRQLLDLVCEECGVELDANIELLNGEYSVERFLYSVTGRRIVQWVAEANALFARMTPDGKLTFARLEERETEFIGAVKSVNVSDYETTPIQRVVVKQKEDDIGVSYPENSEGETYSILGNPLLSTFDPDALRPYIENIAPFLIGMSFVPAKASLVNTKEQTVHAGDIITVADRGGTVRRIPVFSITQRGYALTVTCTGNKSRTSPAAVAEQNKLEVVQGRVARMRADLEEVSASLEQTSISLDAVKEQSATVTQLVDGIYAQVGEVEKTVEGVKSQSAAVSLKTDALDISVQKLQKEKADQADVKEMTERFHFSEDGLTISNSATGMGINVSESQVAFTGGADPTTVITPTEMQTTNLRVGERLDLGNFALLPRTNGNLSMRWTGG